MRRRGRLGDRLAGAAGELLAPVRDDFPLPRNELQRLGHVLADLAQSIVTTAGTDQRRRIDDAFARQMRRQRTPRGLAPLERWHSDLLGGGSHHLRRGLGLRGILFQIGELQFELIEQRATFRGLAELRVPQLLIVSLSFSIINVRAWASASAARRAARSTRSIAFSVVMSSGKESLGLITSD